MLNIIFGNTDNCIYNTGVYFNNTYEDSWLDSNLAKQIIKDTNDLYMSTKTLLLMLNCKNEIFNASTCGDNCAKWILKIAEERDLTIRLGHVMIFEEPFNIRIVNSNTIVSNMEELVIQAHEYNK